MPNLFKSGTTTTNGCIYDGNFNIGVDPAYDYGPTSATSFYNGITPAAGGYTIYQNKAANGPSIRTAANDATLISILQSVGSTGTTAAGALNWARQQTDIMVANIDYPGIVTSGLTLNVDASYVSSYPLSGSGWYDLTKNNNNGTLVSGPTFSTTNGGIIAIPLSTAYIDYGTAFTLGAGDFAIDMWVKYDNLTATTRGLIEKRGPSYTVGGWALRGSSGGILWEQLASAVNYYSLTISTAYTTNWTYIVVTRIGTTTTGYVNGVQGPSQLNDSNNYNYTATSIKTGSNTSSNFANGGAFSLGSTRIYKGQGLTQAQVTQNYNATKTRYGL